MTNLISSLSLGRISAHCADLLLNVVRAATAPTTQSVRLIVLLTKTRRTLRHLDESSLAWITEILQFICFVKKS